MVHWKGKLEPSLAVLYPSGKVWTFPDGGMTDRKCLSWHKRENRRRRFFLTGITVREWSVTGFPNPLSLTVYYWRNIPDGNRHGKSFLTVFDTFPDGNGRHGKKFSGVVKVTLNLAKTKKNASIESFSNFCNNTFLT